MNLSNFLAKLKDLDIKIRNEKGQLKVVAPKGVLSADILNEITQRKNEIILFYNSVSDNSEEYSKIYPAPLQEHYALSHGQRRLWIQHQLDPLSIAYNVPGVYRLKGSLNVESLRAAFRSLVQRHEILRTTFEVIGEEPRQVIHDLDSCGFVLLYEDLRRYGDAEEAVKRLVTEQVESAFDLVSGPLLRASLWQVNEAEYVFSLTMHHIISDGWSMQVLVNEVLALYESHGQGKADPLPPLRIQYKDYAYWQSEQLQGSKLERHQRYWHHQFSDEVPVLTMASDYSRPQVKTYNGATVSIALGASVSQGLKQLSQQQGVTLFMTLLAGVKALLYRYSGQEDIVIGTPVAGRDHEELENQIGFYVNMLALRTRFSGQDTFGQVLEEVKRVTLTSYEHQLYPFDRLIEELPHKRDISRSPLFDVVVVLQNTVAPDNDTHEMRGVSASVYEKGTVSSIVDLRLEFTELSDDIYFILDYNTDLFKRHTAQQFQQHFVQLMSAVLEHGTCSISTLPYLSQRQEQDILRQGFKEGVGYPISSTIVSLFEERVLEFKDSIAVVYEDRSLTYGELNARANQLAHCLHDEYGIESGELVGLLCERSEDLLIGILGILKAGGAYLPLDPGYPAERLRYMLEDSGVRVVVSDGSLRPDGHYSVVELSSAAVGKQRTQNCGVAVKSEDLAYVIYTSGSTGQPKGVMIGHRQVVRLLFNDNFLFDFSHRDVWTLFHSVSFDFSVWEIFGSLLYGGKLVVISKSTARDASAYLNILSEHSVTVVNQVPSAFDQLLWVLEEGQLSPVLHVRYVIFGGEALHPSHLAPWRARYPGSVLVNMYGITETTVHVSYKEIGEEEIRSGVSNIGEVLPTLSLYLLDEHGQVVPVGVEGELYVGGAGLAQGYLNRPELTMERFVPNPFEGGPRLYKSGDRGRRLWDGTIEYLGRQDDQVKIRGYRIETGEIERALERIEGVEKGVVLVWADEGGDKQLIGYVQGSEDLDVDQVRESLRGQLPEHMIPSQVIRVKTFGLTSNGKLDKKSLPSPQALPGRDYVGARTEVERHLVEIWQTVLSRQPIGVTDNFFALGGDSIKAIRVITNVNKQFEKGLKVGDLFIHQSIESLGRVMEDQQFSGQLQQTLQIGRARIAALKSSILGNEEERSQLPAEYEDFYPLTPIESGMIYSSLLRAEEPVYYDQFCFQLLIKDRSSLERVLGQLVERHDILRTSYYLSRFTSPLKVVHRWIRLPFEYEDLRHQSSDAQRSHIREFLEADLSKRLSFDGELLWHMHAFQLGAEQYWLVWNFHHSLLDGWSTGLFGVEASQLLSGHQLKPLVHSYRDYCAFLLGNERSSEAVGYWQRLMEGYVRMKLPFNYSGKRKPGIKGTNILQRSIGMPVRFSLEKISSQYNLSFKAICLSAHIYLLHVLCQEQEVVTGVVSHDRPPIEDADRIMGCFLNTVPGRISLEGVRNYLDLIKAVNHQLNEQKSYEIHLTEIAQAIGEKATTGNPIFDSIFNFTDFHINEDWKENDVVSSHQMVDFADESISMGAEMTNTLFDLEVDRTEKTFSLRIKYARAYFEQIDIEYALDLYVRILEQFAREVASPLRSELLLTEVERNRILHEFNDTVSSYSEAQTLHGLFEAQVQRCPDQIAVICGDHHVSYDELNDRANRLAHYLISEGLNNGDHAGVLCSRSPEMIIALLAILKAGASYVPIDQSYPVERQQYMLTNSKVKVVLTDQAGSAGEDLYRTIVIGEGIAKGLSGSDPRLEKSSKDLAYTIYTSGSTGRPKGVMIDHHAAVNLVEWVNKEFAVDERDKLLFVTSVGFDLSVYDIFGTLSAGGTIVIANQGQVQDVRELEDLMLSEQITFWDSVPSTMHYLVSELEASGEAFNQSRLRVVFLSGDWIGVSLPDRITRYFPQANVISLGGATEGTVWSNYYPITAVDPSWASIPYGRPIANNFFYILDNQGNPVPEGVAGELYIGGVGVARGYANEVEKTALAFVSDRFNPQLGGRMYRTGDLGRLIRSGEMEFLGRCDHQVKIRGFRVELGEIESQLRKIDGVKEALVEVFKDSTGSNTLCAYTVSEEVLSPGALSAYLSSALPAYMVPSHYMGLDKMPLNGNGKLDRRLLPRPELNASLQKGQVEARTDLESRLVTIWESILGVQGIGVTEDLLERGAHSLNLGAFVNRASRQLGVVLNLREVFEHTTVEELAQLIQSKSDSAHRKIEPVLPEPHYALSHAQKRLWIEQQINPESIVYNISGAYRLDGEVGVSSLGHAFAELVSRHESLRTIFIQVDGSPRQQVREVGQSEFSLRYRDLRGDADAEEKVRKEIHHQGQSAFDLSQGPLLRADLWQLTDDNYVVALTMHHIISDGWSMQVLLDELMVLYDSYEQGLSSPLKPLRIQYKDYANWQRAQLEGASLAEHQRYWHEQFSGDLPVLALPTDYDRPPVKTSAADRVSLMLDESLTQSLKELSHRHGATLFMTIVATVKALLYRYTGQEDIVIGTPVAGRDHEDLDNQIGFYINMLALRTRFSGSDTFERLLGRVKETMLGAYQYQVYPFDRLVEELPLKRDMSRSPLFDVVVVMQNAVAVSKQHTIKTALAIKEYKTVENVINEDIRIEVQENFGGINITIAYNLNLLTSDTIKSFSDRFIFVLREMVLNPTTEIDYIEFPAISVVTNIVNDDFSFHF